VIMKNFAYILALVVLTAVGCKKTPIEQSIKATSSLKGTGLLNDQPFTFAAGENNTIMEPSFDRNDEGVNEFVGEFKKDNGELTSLKFVIQDDDRRLPVESVSVDIALSEGMYSFQTDEVPLDPLKLQFYSLAFAEGLFNYTWNLNGDVVSGQEEPEFPIVSFEEYADFNMFLEVTSIDGDCSDTLHQLAPAYEVPSGLANYHKLPFVKTYLANGGVRFSYPGEVIETTQIKWDVIEDDENYTVNDAPEYTHYFSSDGPHQVSMNVIMENGYVFKYVENVAPFQNVCAASIQYEHVPVDPSAVSVSNVRIDFTDENGIQYSSYNPVIEEDLDREFEVSDVTDFNTTSTGLETRKVQVLFSCTVYDVNDPTNSLRIDDFSGTIAVSFPQ
jgi:hypothetical protein